MATKVEYELLERQADGVVVRITTERQKQVLTTEYLIKPIGLAAEVYAVRKTDESEAYATWTENADRYVVVVEPRTGALTCDCQGYQGWKNRCRKGTPACKHTLTIGWLREAADLGPRREEALHALALLRSPLLPEQVTGEVARALLTLRHATEN